MPVPDNGQVELTREEWAEAFAKQARSDWEVYKDLAAVERLPVCHPLHYLQMACEKIAKAYRCRDTDADLKELLKRHVGFEKFIGQYLVSSPILRLYKGNVERLAAAKLHLRGLAREVERLTPAIDPARTPENAEYPWQQGASVIVPCDHPFSNLESRIAPLLKIVEQALREFPAQPA